MTARGVLIAGTASRSGKTTVTLGLARALRRFGQQVRCAKSGPDYIDPGYLSAASGAPCPNLDGWAMDETRLSGLLPKDGLLLVEGAMGLFDGAPPDGTGSSADIARRLGLPVILVVDCASMGQSVAAIVHGYTALAPDLNFAGVILNRVGSDRHARILTTALADQQVPLVGVLPRNPALHRPSRHLGLIQATEMEGVDAFLDTAADYIAAEIDLDKIIDCARALKSGADIPRRRQPLGQRIALAQDAAFSFIYPHLVDDWRAAGAEIHPFSPLADEAPDPDADAIYLPGGYPELHAQHLTRAGQFRRTMKAAADKGTSIYGECGGYMVLGNAITDARNVAYPMLGLLDLETSFAQRKLHLGYRDLTPLRGPFTAPLKGHEFHYATTLYAHGAPLFAARDAEGTELSPMGLVAGSVSGSFGHVIDCA